MKRTSTLDNAPDVLTVDEAAGILRIGRNTAYEAVKQGELPSCRVRGRILIPKRSLEALLAHGQGSSDE